MTDLRDLNHEDFIPCLEQGFRTTLDNGAAFELRLIEVKPLDDATPAASRQPFSLLFRGPAEPVLAQQLVQLENDTLGPLTLFLVPIIGGEDGMHYEAAFN